MARKKKQISQGEVLKSVATARGLGTIKSYLAGRGMMVLNKETLTEKCYLCLFGGSFDNQLIPRWISKETMVCICAGCYERTAGWIQVDKDKKFLGMSIGEEAELITKALSQAVEWNKVK